MAETPRRESLVKRKADEISTDDIEAVEETPVSEGPESKRFKGEFQSQEDRSERHDVHERWTLDMGLPEGRPRPVFTGETEEERLSGSGTVEDPLIVWLAKIPPPDSDAGIITANQDIARQAAMSLGDITHVYIRCAAQTSKFVDRDGKRIPIWNPDNIYFRHRTAPADAHLALAFGTDADTLVLHGYVNVDVDEDGKPIDFATSRNPENVVDGDDRIFELFPYEEEFKDCAPYCPDHASQQVLINACESARPRYCRFHNTEGLLDHWCHRARWKTEALGDHYCPCQHGLEGIVDHYCPCPHDKSRRPENIVYCQHDVAKKDRILRLHYCPSSSF